MIISFDDVGFCGEEGLIPVLQPIDDDSIITSKDSGDTWLDWNYFPEDD